jgi:hypothetical protein
MWETITTFLASGELPFSKTDPTVAQIISLNIYGKYSFIVIPFYLQSVPVHAANCVKKVYNCVYNSAPV